MRDTELYQHLLGLTAPWRVSRIELSVKSQQVDVWVDHPDDQEWQCSECKRVCGLHDHGEERTWRHLDSCQFKTLLHARPPRVQCPEHQVRQVRLPWAEPNSRFTALFERFAIEVLKEASVTGAGAILRLSWDEVWGIQQRAVLRGQARKQALPLRRIGVDEKSIAKRHQYFTLVYDLDRATVEFIGEDRKQATLDGFYQGLPSAHRESIEAVAMDMWDPYISSTKANIPHGHDKIVFDRYHIMAHMNKALNNVRKKEHRALMAEGDETLIGSKNLWLYGRENLPRQHREHFTTLKAANLATGRAYAIKETLRDLWNRANRRTATKHWNRWYHWASHSRLAPVMKAARTIKLHIANILTYFEHRITNALAEGINSKIQGIKKRACGFRNRDHFKIAILFHCGGLDLYPETPGHSKP